MSSCCVCVCAASASAIAISADYYHSFSIALASLFVISLSHLPFLVMIALQVFINCPNEMTADHGLMAINIVINVDECEYCRCHETRPFLPHSYTINSVIPDSRLYIVTKAAAASAAACRC